MIQLIFTVLTLYLPSESYKLNFHVLGGYLALLAYAK